MPFKAFATSLIACFCTVSLFAQLQLSALEMPSPAVLAASENEIFTQSAYDNAVIFIDLEPLAGQFTDLRIKNASNEILFKEDLTALPTNSIYELNLHFLEKGSYTIELRTFKGVLEKDVER